MSTIRKVILHCSDSPDELDIGVAEIRKWHTMPPPQGRGWSDVGYHFVVRRSGLVEVGRYENGDSVLEGKEIGAHVLGHNSDSLGVCWVGRNKLIGAQRSGVLRLIANLLNVHHLAVKDVYGHCEFDPKKTCPNVDMNMIRAALLALIANQAAAV